MLVIFSKLKIQAADRAWIDDIRCKYDPRHQLVEPHFTLVFPFDGVPADDVLGHAQDAARESSPIAFRLSRAAAVRPLLGPSSHIFLLPGEGKAKIRALHARLYSGILAPKLHPTAVYAPHVTVGVFKRHEDAERAAASLEAFDIRGALDALQVADFDGTSLTELRELPFGLR